MIHHKTNLSFSDIIAVYNSSLPTIQSHYNNTIHYYNIPIRPLSSLVLYLYYLFKYPSKSELSSEFKLSMYYVRVIIDLFTIALYNSLPSLYIHSSYKNVTTIINDFIPSTSVAVDSSFIKLHVPNNNFDVKLYYHVKSPTRFAIKFEVASLLNGFIWHVSSAVPGVTDDRKIMRESGVGPLLKDNFRAIADKAYRGAPLTYSPWYQPRKKLKVSLEENKKKFNHVLEKQRCIIENVFHRLKRWEIIGGIYRGRKYSLEKITRIIHIVCSLYNLIFRDHPLRT